ncbi:lectin like domain-containing protein [Gordonibacter massiliensis (ex Traore et al. 2017)]|uniref:lectin like domain-containing protein n=1 Tax=Gordonibacter massiliensis (ex Traore et al. 2017) TaxID=1841863 RepID=UPI001C8C7A3F|nr:lectin like domain-containing protein [Gordonibacter massiliensis (ex Traore et al. 2017)]MBX9035203.1 PASTA domain-containing protein [Gordonibacter massiliensis (ex Traore et al. 2017)]
MDKANPVARLARGALAFALAASLAPTTASADETSPRSGIADGFIASSEQAVARYATTGNPDDLRDVRAYQGNGIMLLNADLPEKLDLRDRDVVTPVKLQNPWGTCWSFAAIAASETSIMSELGITTDDGAVDLSELHTAWFSYMPLPEGSGSQAGEGIRTTSTDPAAVLDQGGDLFTTTSVFSSGVGPVAESLVPYRNKCGCTEKKDGIPVYYSSEGDWSVDEDLRFVQEIELEESSILPSPAGRSDSGSYTYNESGTQAIKRELQEGRAVSILFAADQSQPGQGSQGRYINPNTWAQYTYDESASATHAVSIVGWDNSYSKYLFEPDLTTAEGELDPQFFVDGDVSGELNEDGKAIAEDSNRIPASDGAWIVKNSWGSKDVEFPHRNPNGWGVDGGGYFYLSYYDKSVVLPESFDYYTENYGESAEYYLINQYDFMPSPGVTAQLSDDPVSMANVFEASEHQMVRSLSCETAQPGTEVDYEVYLLNDGYASPKDGKLLAKASETYEYGGYHRIQLKEPLPIEQGQHFSVVVTQQCDGLYCIPVDRALNKTGVDKLNEELGLNYSRYAVGVVNKGESFTFEDGEWADWFDVVASIKAAAAETEPGDIFDYDNFAIKAYADPMGEPPIHEAVVVPDLGGMTEAEALAALEQAGLKGEAGEPEHSDAVEAGRVIRQGTPAGTEVDKGFIVTYHLSLGKEQSGEQGGAAGGGGAGGTAGGKPMPAMGDTAAPIAGALAVALASAVVAVAGFRMSGRRSGRPRC